MTDLDYGGAHVEEQQSTYDRSILKLVGAAALFAVIGTALLDCAASAQERADAAADQSAQETTEEVARETEENAAPAYSPAEALASVRIGRMRGWSFHDAPRTPEPVAYFGPEGELRDFREFEGKVVLVNFWALWCPPCLTELPSIDRLAAEMSERLGEDVVVVAVNVDRGDAARPLNFLAANGLDSVVFLHDPVLAALQKLNVAQMPTTLLLDRRGDEIGRFVGPAEWDAAEAVLLLERAAELP